MKLSIAILASFATAYVAPAISQEVPRPLARSNPSAPPEAIIEINTERQYAARLFLEAQCKLYSAMSSFDESSNGSIIAAADNFSQAADLFFAVAERLRSHGNTALATSGTPEIKRAVAAFMDRGIDVPETYADAFQLLADVSSKASQDLSDTRYNSTPERNQEVLNGLLRASGASAEIFVAVSALTALSLQF